MILSGSSVQAVSPPAWSMREINCQEPSTDSAFWLNNSFSIGLWVEHPKKKNAERAKMKKMIVFIALGIVEIFSSNMEKLCTTKMSSSLHREREVTALDYLLKVAIFPE